MAPEVNRPPGWGIEQAISEGWGHDRIFDWLKSNAKLYEPKPPPSPGLADLWQKKKDEAKLRQAETPHGKLWRAWGLQLSNAGVPVSNLHNVVNVLEQDEKAAGLFWFDSFLQRVMTGNPPREWSDADDLTLTLHIQREVGLTRTGRDLVAQAVLGIAHQRQRHCVRDWIDGLHHDGQTRLETFFADCFGAEESDYTQAASKNFWLSLVARAYRPGCQVDNMVVLEGAQGVGKSTALRIIGGDWFAEQHESATNPKGFAEILQGKLLIEISEMDAFNRVEVNRVKQTISCGSDRFRASYGRYAQDHPRQCIFVGTTNRDDWNRDETGARRFWPIACRGQIRTDLVAELREQLFAEAAARYKAKEEHWVMPGDATKAEQEARFEADPWLERIAEVIKGEGTVTSAWVAEKLEIDLKHRDRGTEMRIGKCLRFLNWKKTVRRIDGQPTRLYVNPGLAHA